MASKAAAAARESQLPAPDGTSVTISTFLKLTADVASAFTVKGLIPTGTDLNTLGAPTSLGIYHQTNNTNATLALNYPENRAGTLFVTPGPCQGCQQMYITFEGTIYTRGCRVTGMQPLPRGRTGCLQAGKLLRLTLPT